MSEVKDDAERAKRQRSRSIAIAWALGLMAIIFYAATIVRLGPNALRRDDFNKHSTPGAAEQAPVEDCKKAGTC